VSPRAEKRSPLPPNGILLALFGEKWYCYKIDDVAETLPMVKGGTHIRAKKPGVRTSDLMACRNTNHNGRMQAGCRYVINLSPIFEPDAPVSHAHMQKASLPKWPALRGHPTNNTPKCTPVRTPKYQDGTQTILSYERPPSNHHSYIMQPRIDS
jgi:hypothetical protein